MQHGFKYEYFDPISQSKNSNNNTSVTLVIRDWHISHISVILFLTENKFIVHVSLHIGPYHCIGHIDHADVNGVPVTTHTLLVS